MSCKAKNCVYYKKCLARWDCADHHCADYKCGTPAPTCKTCLNYPVCSDPEKGASICGAYERR